MRVPFDIEEARRLQKEKRRFEAIPKLIESLFWNGSKESGLRQINRVAAFRVDPCSVAPASTVTSAATAIASATAVAPTAACGRMVVTAGKIRASEIRTWIRAASAARALAAVDCHDHADDNNHDCDHASRQPAHGRPHPQHFLLFPIVYESRRMTARSRMRPE